MHQSLGSVVPCRIAKLVLTIEGFQDRLVWNLRIERNGASERQAGIDDCEFAKVTGRSSFSLEMWDQKYGQQYCREIILLRTGFISAKMCLMAGCHTHHLQRLLMACLLYELKGRLHKTSVEKRNIEPR